MKRSLLAAPIAVALAVGGAACGASGTQHRSTAGAAQAPATPSTVNSQAKENVQLHRRMVNLTIHNFAFEPARLVVSRGTRLVWTNQDSDPHTVTASTAGWSSAALDTGNHFAAVLSRDGTFAYSCTIHPYMHGIVIVRG